MPEDINLSLLAPILLKYKGQEDALKAITYLKEGKLGQGSFLPVDFPRPQSPTVSPQIEGDGNFLGPLKDFVRIKKEYRSLLENLFDGVWLVKDLM